MSSIPPTNDGAVAAVARLLECGQNVPSSLERAILRHGDAAVAPLIELVLDAGGWAPIHAAHLLGELRSEAAIEPMLDLLLEGVEDDVLEDALDLALEGMGPPVVEPVLARWDAAEEGTVRFSFACMLASSGVRDDRIYERLLDEFEREPEWAAMHLAEYGDPRALDVLSRAFDAYEPSDDDDASGAALPVELREAILQLDGTLTPAQQVKYDVYIARATERYEATPATPGPPPRAMRPGRNEPCWCGSEKKYKKCHLASDDEAPDRPD